MRYSDKIKNMTPASLPIAAIPDRDETGKVIGVIDIYPIRSEDMFWLVNKAPEIVGAFAQPEEQRLEAMVRAASLAGLEVVHYLLARALGSTVAEMDATKDARSLEFDVDVLEAFFAHGVPQSFFEKLVGGLNRVTGGKLQTLATVATQKLLSLNIWPTSSTPSQESTTPTS